MTQQPGDAGGPLVIAPSRPRAAGWALLGAVTLLLAGFALARSDDPLLPSALIMVTAAVTGAFTVQVFAPAAWTIRLGSGLLRGYVAGRPVDVVLRDIDALTIERMAGDRALVVHGPSGRRRLLLPVGADLGALQSAIEMIDDDTARPQTDDPAGTE